MTTGLIIWNFTGLDIGIDPGLYGEKLGYTGSPLLEVNQLDDTSHSRTNPLQLPFGSQRIMKVNPTIDQISTIKCSVVTANIPSGSRFTEIYTPIIVGEAYYEFQVDSDVIAPNEPGSYINTIQNIHLVYGIAESESVITNYPFYPGIKYIGPRGEILNYADIKLAYSNYFDYSGQYVVTYGIGVTPNPPYSMQEILWGMTPLCNKALTTLPPV